MENPPSRVIHIRKLPNEVSETEVIALGLPFGKVTNILMLKGKNQVWGQNLFFLFFFLFILFFFKNSFIYLFTRIFLAVVYIVVHYNEVIK